MKQPLISTIIPIHNVEKYLSAAIESILLQDIGFEDNIELILINDGSIDTSSVICKDYTRKYPSNIHYKKQSNAGVSRTRNIGLSTARGQYVHFFDGDDLLSKDFYSQTVKFLTNNQAVDFVAAKISLFDENIDNHPLNDKFDRDKIIDLDEGPDNPLLHAVTCLFRRDSIKHLVFDERLQVAEDVTFISDALINKRRYGVVKKPTYFYRKRTGGGSAIATKERNISYYRDTPVYAYKHMLDSWQSSARTTSIEYTLLYDAAYFLEQKKPDTLTESEAATYRSLIRDILSRCSDEVILQHRFLSPCQKSYILRHKYGKKFAQHIRYKDLKAYFDDRVLYDYRQARVFLDFIDETSEDSYIVEGYIGGVPLPVEVIVDVSGRKYPTLRKERVQRQKSFLHDVYDDGGAFESKVVASSGTNISVKIKVGDEEITVPIDTGRFTRFGALKMTYRRDKTKLLKRTKLQINIYNYSAMRHFRLEARFWLQLLINWRLHSALDQYRKLRNRNLKQLSVKAKIVEMAKPVLIIGEAVLMIPRALLLRSCYYIFKQFKKRPLWIISDRGTMAGDNGEALFRYIMQQEDRPADVYFALSKKSKDYERMHSIGPLLHQNNFYYKFKFLFADKIISSQADIETTNPFIRQMDHYVDLFNFDFVFLQHGIIRHNLSDWLNRYDKNIRLFITSADKEYQSIFANPYYYPKQNVLLSGLPRYDYLESKPNKKLILAPTYRKGLVRQRTDKVGVRNYDPSFKSSYYRQFYNSLINDERLISALQKAGMKGEFYLHPAFSAQRDDFDENGVFKLMNFPYDYKAAFREGEFLISDHSSVVFDFAYLKKPVAYAHFDVDTFFDSHSYSKSNFFFDDKDGFGEVYYNYDTLVNGVIRSIETGRKMPLKFQSRVDKFFYRVDKQNCQRVYEAINRLG